MKKVHTHDLCTVGGRGAKQQGDGDGRASRHRLVRNSVHVAVCILQFFGLPCVLEFLYNKINKTGR